MKAIDWGRFSTIRGRIHGDHSVATLAKRVGTSTRTFLRRFEAATGVTPARWLSPSVLQERETFWESSEATIEKVAEISGFLTTATLRHHFRKQLGTTPAAYRAAFGSSV